jgi:hypothetical protein
MPSDEPLSAAAMIEALDTRIFAIQPNHYADRTSFLRVQRMIRALKPGYEYLEVGSDIGASLLPHMLDPNCGGMVSFDPRPERQPDERGVDFPYLGNSTARMLRELGEHASPAQLARLLTIDADVSAPGAVPPDLRPDLVLIDGEHTNVAAFSDFITVLSLISEDAIITFHDADLISDTLEIAERLLVQRRTRHSMVILPSCVAVFGFGAFADAVETELAPHGEARKDYFAAARRQRHSMIADAVIGRTEGLPAADIPGLRAWTETVEQRFDAAKAVADLSAAREIAQSAEISRLRQEIENLEKQATVVMASTSWKVTAPVRAAGRLLKGRRA